MNLRNKELDALILGLAILIGCGIGALCAMLTMGA